ncbi:hypothetical protein GJV52_00800 [Neisseria brasiliensis]|uniref:pyocin knob domain-containing protein n=1 Tax=Neisseria brasiliensis TaxID=2666100 RepID=UPI0012A9BE88|nr:pyocin knob domain-containing protein [Neisseria brasiliensis]QGL24216.1 hypothetical protein GJV52_00800 [Neisseria brasiliensis]
MGNLIDQNLWTNSVRQIEPGDSVIGGLNAPINICLMGINNRTVWLKTELAKAVESIGRNESAVEAALNTKANANTTITAGNGLSGGGNLTANRTIALGTPSKITASTNNSVSGTSHTHEIDKASTTTAGVVQLYNGLGSTATDLAATAAVAKKLNEIKATKSTTLAGYGIEDWVVSGISLSSSDNLNSLTAKGFYYQAATANASLSNNYPEARAGVLVVSYSGGSMQRYTTIDGHEYVRVFSSSWGSWLRVDGRDAVMTSGSQTIDGEKTFNHRTYHNGGVTFSNSNGDNTGRLGSNTSDTYIENTQTRKFLQLKNDGSLAYSNDPILLQSSLSNAVNSRSSTTPASVAGVKTAYDKAVKAATATRRSYSRTINGTASGRTEQTMRVTGETVISPDGSVVQYFNIKNAKPLWFGFEDGSTDAGRLIDIDLWTAMPNKVCYASIQFVRATDTNISQRWQHEASEHKYSWNPRGTNKNKVSFNSRRWAGTGDELIDMVIKVEGY